MTETTRAAHSPRTPGPAQIAVAQIAVPATDPARPAIVLHGLTRRYADGSAGLDGVDLTIDSGESVAIVGPTGSGKSTLLNLIAGLDRPTAGTVTVGGIRVDTLGEAAGARLRRRTVGMIFQFFNLLDDLTVLDNVMLPAQLAGTPAAEARAVASGLLRDLGIARHGSALPGRLSGGERQRVAVARALVNGPAVLLADEPTGALDSAAGQEVADLLRSLHADGQTVVLVTHDRALAAACTARTVELVDGRVSRDVTGTAR